MKGAEGPAATSAAHAVVGRVPGTHQSQQVQAATKAAARALPKRPPAPPRGAGGWHPPPPHSAGNPLSLRANTTPFVPPVTTPVLREGLTAASQAEPPQARPGRRAGSPEQQQRPPAPPGSAGDLHPPPPPPPGHSPSPRRRREHSADAAAASPLSTGPQPEPPAIRADMFSPPRQGPKGFQGARVPWVPNASPRPYVEFKECILVIKLVAISLLIFMILACFI